MKKMQFIFVLLSFVMLISCQADEKVVVVTATPEPTLAPTKTVVPTQTAVPTLEPTPTPQGQIFYDDFNKTLQPEWEMLNENTLKWAFTNDGWLKIVAEDTCLLDEHFQKNMLVQYAPEGNFMIETLVQADPDTNFQQAAIYVIEDDNNYFSINRGYCQPCAPKGSGLYSDYSYKGEWGSSFGGRAYKDELVYLRIAVNRDKKEIIAFYSSDGEKWTQLRKIPLVINVNQIGLGTSNCDQDNIDDNLVAQFDYFKVSVLE